ncbi:MAG: hypothetical protein LUG57_10475 [Oscillospiraceae bacterium]|nr:hypothetical protein [Oscillospiraceae bacterium]
MNKELTIEQRMHNACGSIECERLHAIHQLLAMSCHQPEEFATIWDRSDDCGWGFMWGWLKGWKEIVHAQFVNLEIKHLIYDVEMPKIYPETAGVESGIIGFTEFNELNSGVVEVADDGMSCRMSFICHGMWYIHYNEDLKPWGSITNEQYGADFIYDEETKHWKFLHELVAPDGSVGDDFDSVNNANQPYQQLCEKVPAPHLPGWNVPYQDIYPDICKAPEGDIEEYTSFSDAMPPPRSYRHTIHHGWSPVQPVQLTVTPPRPYATLDDENTYCPPEAKTESDIFFKDGNGIWRYNVRKRFAD